MFILMILAAATGGSAPDAVDLDLSKRCGVELPRDASMTYAGDLWRVLYDERLAAGKIQCIEAWAKSYPKAGGILAYRRSQFVVPEQYRSK
jgi:hypothetical protein